MGKYLRISGDRDKLEMEFNDGFTSGKIWYNVEENYWDPSMKKWKSKSVNSLCTDILKRSSALDDTAEYKSIKGYDLQRLKDKWNKVASMIVDWYFDSDEDDFSIYEPEYFDIGDGKGTDYIKLMKEAISLYENDRLSEEKKKELEEFIFNF